MKLLKQFLIMFLALELHIIPLSSVKDVGRFLIEIMPVMFIPAAVGLLNAWNILKPNWIIYTVIMFATTFIVMILSGKVTQAVIRKGKKRETAEISPSEEVTAEPVESLESNETIGSDVRKGGDET